MPFCYELFCIYIRSPAHMHYASAATRSEGKCLICAECKRNCRVVAAEITNARHRVLRVAYVFFVASAASVAMVLCS